MYLQGTYITSLLPVLPPAGVCTVHMFHLNAPGLDFTVTLSVMCRVRFDGYILGLRVWGYGFALSSRLVCMGLVCKGLVCKGLVCKGLVCMGLVCKGLVCKGLVCKGLVCMGLVPLCWCPL